MRICIHRGTKEIGGTCVEIESHGKRLVLDVGLPLDVIDPNSFPLHPISGFAATDDSLLGVVISHPHQDHYGLAYRLPIPTTFLIGKAAEAILAAAGLFSPGGVKFQNTVHLEDRKQIKLGPFTVMPFLIDHSAYEAAPKSVMLFRPSVVRDLEAANCLNRAAVICSVWAGYLDDPANKPFIAWMRERGIVLHRCHTSGHASVADLRRLREAFPAAVAVPVHLADRDGFATLFSNVELHEDGEWWVVS